MTGKRPLKIRQTAMLCQDIRHAMVSRYRAYAPQSWAKGTSETSKDEIATLQTKETSVH